MRTAPAKLTYQQLSSADWQPEMNRIMAKYLMTGTIIALVLNPIFGLVDFYTAETRMIEFMTIRTSVTVLLLWMVVNGKLIREQPLKAGLIVLSALVAQDGWFFSGTPRESLQQVSLAYLVDFVGAGMVLLWTPVIAVAFVACFISVMYLFYSMNSEIPFSDFMVEGGLLVLAAVLFSMAMIVFRHQSVKSMLISRLELIKSNEWMAVQNEIIEEKSAELQKSNNRLTEFAYIVSHDLKAPLRGIKNIAMWIREDCAGTLNDTALTHMALMDKQIIKMENLIKAVLEYSKTGTRRGNVEWIHLDSLIKDVIEMVDMDANTRFTISTKVPELKGTKIVISQVLQNLISNSVKHNKNEKKKVEIEVVETDGMARFMVADNGPGIAAIDQERIFDLFQNLRNSVDYDSSGIGLSVARKMIEENGGRMWLESEQGRGAKFYFTVPLDDQVN